MLSSIGKYESSDDDYCDYGITYQRQNKQWHQQEVFLDSDDNTDKKSWGRNDMVSLRRPYREEIKALTVAAIEQDKSNYNMRNRTINQDQGKSASMFIKEKNINLKTRECQR